MWNEAKLSAINLRLLIYASARDGRTQSKVQTGETRPFDPHPTSLLNLSPFFPPTIPQDHMMVIVYIITGLKGAKIAGKPLFLGVSLKVFLEQISI